ncbi:hypothetical protein HYC85_007728 [Camellia sinensis]|uniref:Uncharacterized protein n=1 Tax=Camellia sinensis TaxID=4442 RepID=A0A7J7HPS2_CAMSI|nr:hypothetical protein HYC85_007728 [Camellia sinensis]
MYRVNNFEFYRASSFCCFLISGQHEGRKLANLKVKEPIDSIRKAQFVQHRYPFENTEREINIHHNNSSSFPDDDLLSIVVKQVTFFSCNSSFQN